jgi:hypothetical protein
LIRRGRAGTSRSLRFDLITAATCQIGNTHGVLEHLQNERAGANMQ